MSSSSLPSSSSLDTGRKYATQCTGPALDTVNAHAQSQDITLFASCFCPFVQRAWVALEHLHIPYKYCEVDPYQKSADLLAVSPKGLVPALQLVGERGHVFSPPRSLHESTVILEYLENLAGPERSLLPPPSQPYAIALVRLQADHVSRALVPAFYRYLQAQSPAPQASAGAEFADALRGLVGLLARAERELRADRPGTAPPTCLGLWVEGGELGWVDVMAGPWLFRATNVLAHYRGFEMPRLAGLDAWLGRLLGHPAFRRTCSTEQLYLDSYERYAFNRPNTSLVAKAINEGKALP